MEKDEEPSATSGFSEPSMSAIHKGDSECPSDAKFSGSSSAGEWLPASETLADVVEQLPWTMPRIFARQASRVTRCGEAFHGRELCKNLEETLTSSVSHWLPSHDNVDSETSLALFALLRAPASTSPTSTASMKVFRTIATQFSLELGTGILEPNPTP